MRNDFFSQFNQVKLKNYKEIIVVKMYETGITILTREDLITEKSLKKLMKLKCPHADTATAWELRYRNIQANPALKNTWI